MLPPFQAIAESRTSTAKGAILFDSARLAQGDPRWLNADQWPATAGRGRGVVRAVEGPFGRAILRPYRRGGLMARFSRRRYLWTGENSTRAFSEFRLLSAMRAQQLPVPAPLCAGYERSGLSYQAAILTSLIDNTKTLAEHGTALLERDERWASLGELLARFHAAGFCHADLNAHNLLLDDGGQWWLIDFDRGYRRDVDGRWPLSRLARLQRSLRKLGFDRHSGWQSAWSALLDAHQTTLRAATSSATTDSTTPP